jgi:CMP-N-acetylneuraminic acid synthetase
METEQNDFVEVATGRYGARVKVPRVQRIRDFDTRWCNLTVGQEHIRLFWHAILWLVTHSSLRKEAEIRKAMEKKFSDLAGDDTIWAEAIEHLHSKGYLVRFLEAPDYKHTDQPRQYKGELLLTTNGAYWGGQSAGQLGLEG